MIPIKQVHQLTIGSSETKASPDHISAASSLVRHEGQLLVVADDELSLAIFDEHDLGHGHLIPIIEGELPDDPDKRKEEKPDLESLTLLDPFADFRNGALLAVGSGSSDKRNRGALIPLNDKGYPLNNARPVDLAPLYEGLAKEVPHLNIEGLAASEGKLYFAQRGNGPDAQDALVVLELEGFLSSLVGGTPPSADLLVEVQPYDLGQLRGVELSFSDLSPLDDGRLAFSCSAEDSGDTYQDGEIFGSALGIVRPGGDVEYLEPVDGFVKIEGIDAKSTDDGLHILIVMDADDPSKPSPLLGATII